MARKDVLHTDIPDLDTPWAGDGYAYGGDAIEALLRGSLKARYGYIERPLPKGTDNFYHIRCFADQASYSQYMTDPDAHAALLLADIPIPITEDKGVADVVTLTRESAGSMAVSKKQASVTVTYRWQQYNPITQETALMDEEADVTVDVRMQQNGGTWGAWDTGKQFATTISSGQTKTIDLSSLLTSDGTYQMRLIARGETSGVQASPVTVTILYSDVSLAYAGKASTPYGGASFGLPFRISGSTDKKLYVKINGYAKPYHIGTTPYMESVYTAMCEKEEFGLQRGVADVEAWVAFGEGYAYETEHTRFQFIYIPPGDTQATPILAVTDVVESFTNWTRQTVFRYAVFNPSATTTAVNIELADRDTGEVYLSGRHECANGEDYAFEENFAIEPDTEDVPTVIRGRFQFTDAQGRSFGNNINVTIDNSETFAATRGATFVLNPERQSITAGTRSWTLADVMADLVDTNSGWKRVEETDSEGASVNVPVLAVAAGNRVTVPYDTFDAGTGLYNGGVEGSTTIELDIRVSNIVAEEQPVIDMAVPYVDAFCGLKVYPMRAVCLSRANNIASLCDAGFQEDVREHIAVNIIRDLRNEGINYVRIYVNGKCNREYVYAGTDAFVPLNGLGKGSIVIGSDDADVEVFGIRIYKGVQLGSTQIQNDYMASMPTIADKRLFRRRNSIYNGTAIEYEPCNNMGYNTILRRIPAGGHYPSLNQPDDQKNVDVVVKIFDRVGDPSSLDRRHSGTFHHMKIKGQGTSAKGYYWWNITDGFSDAEEITAEQYVEGNPEYKASKGRYYKKKSWFVSEDGSQNHTEDYEIEAGRGGITKLNGKCNYASMQQSHKLGNVWLYDELWQRLVNNGAGGRPVLPGHAACYQKPFLCFYQIGDGQPVFCGMQTWGSAKGDKKTFGFDKSASPGYMCVSGADNGAVAALYQMPIMMEYDNEAREWRGNMSYQDVVINTGDHKKGYCYRDGSGHTLAFEVEIANKHDEGDRLPNGGTALGDELKGDSETTFMVDFAKFTQFVCASSPLLKPYNGTAAQLVAASADLEHDHQYWISANNADRYRVFYYNPASRRFEELPCIPTAWGEGGDKRHTAMGARLITEQVAGMKITVCEVGGDVERTIEEAMDSTSDVNLINDYLSKARVAYFVKHAEAYIDVDDAVFQQCWVRLEAATDNRTKNTYPWIDGTIDKLVRWKNDDDDTVKNTDNQGQLTKPYHILEHTKDENGKNYWNGENNVFFTLIERAYESRMRTMMNNMFTAMSQISGSVFQYYDDRFFWVQRYFPAVAYNETVRLLYEVAKYNFDNNIGVRPSQDPITQAIGDQLESEQQYVKQRLPMLMSWCSYENFDGMGSTGWRSVTPTYGGRPTYDVEFTAYQYIYPKMSCGGNIAELYARDGDGWVRQNGQYLCAPGETVRMVLTTDSNTQFSLVWLNYCKRLGNLGTLPVLEEGSVAISGKRLRSLEIWSADGVANEFRPRGGINLTCRNLESVNLTNAPFSGTFEANLPRCRALLLGGTQYSIVNVPQTSALRTLVVPSTIMDLKITAQPNLSDLTMLGMENLQVLRFTGRHMVDTYPIMSQLYAVRPPDLLDVAVEGLDWTGCTHDVLMYLAGKGARLQGTVRMRTAADEPYVSFADKTALARLYGDIDDAANPLHIVYTRRVIQSVAITGRSFMPTLGTHRMGIATTPDGNNFRIVDGRPAIRWTLANSAAAYARVADSVEGAIEVTATEDATSMQRHTLTLEVTTVEGGGDRVLGATREVGFYRRIPMVGDFAYADGDFDTVYDQTRPLAGIVFMREEVRDGGDRLTGYLARVVSAEDMKVTRTGNKDWALHLMPWGLFNSADPRYANIIFATDTEDDIKRDTGLSSAFNVPTITDNGKSGLGANTEVYGIIDDSTYIDDSQPDGYRRITNGGVVADFNGKELTRKIIDHMTAIVTLYKGESLPQSIPELGDAMLAEAEAQFGNVKGYQFYYPAAFVCHLFEPECPDLDANYAKGNWYLPSAGELARIFNFYRHGTAIADADTNAANEARTPIFANANARAGKVVVDIESYLYNSSNEASTPNSWYIIFQHGNVAFGQLNAPPKGTNYRVRAVCQYLYNL